jgi:tRNA pseudouridine38-40 synthase
MNYYKIFVAYDGTDFHGWQIQPEKRSIASQLKKSFQVAFKCNVDILGASRTDAGVHALGQIARCQTELNLDQNTIFNAWNNSLPNSISIRSLEKTSYEQFHPLQNVSQKTYLYHIFLERPLPLVSRYGWYWKFINQVDTQKFQTALKLFLGTHDFRSFVKLEKEKSTVRTIDVIRIRKIESINALQVIIKGKSFLRFQIRRMIGAAIDIAQQPETPVEYITDMLQNPCPQQALAKAEASGLCLHSIRYNS